MGENSIRDFLRFSEVDFHSYQKYDHRGPVAKSDCHVELFKGPGSKQPFVHGHSAVAANVNWMGE